MHQAQQIRHLGRPRQYECRGQVAAEGSLGRTENANAVASTARIVGRRARRRRHFYPALAFVGISTQRSGHTICRRVPSAVDGALDEWLEAHTAKGSYYYAGTSRLHGGRSDQRKPGRREAHC